MNGQNKKKEEISISVNRCVWKEIDVENDTMYTKTYFIRKID